MSPSREQSTSRAEQLRQKRQQETQQRVQQAGRNITSQAVTARPVMARNNTATGRPTGRTVGQTPARNVRKQVYYSLGAESAEIRMPAMPTVHLGWRLLSGTIVISMLVGLLAILTSAQFQVALPKTSGFKRVNANDIEAVVLLTGKSVFEVDPDKVMAEMSSAFPELKNVRISVGFPANVTITAVERKPILAWTQGDQTKWVDAEGVIMPARGDAGSKLVTVRANAAPPEYLQNLVDKPNSVLDFGKAPLSTGKKMDLTILSAIFKLATKMPTGTTLTFDNQYGLGWVDSHGWQVYLGFGLEDFDAKMNIYQAIVNQLSKQGINPSIISVEHLDEPFYRTQ